MATISGKSLWDDPSVQAVVDRMDPAELYMYQKMMSKMVNSATHKNPYANFVDIAVQTKLMLRDGLPPSMLSDEESKIFVDIYGLEALKSYEQADTEPKS